MKTEELQDSVNDEGPVGRRVGRRRAQDLAMADKGRVWLEWKKISRIFFWSFDH